MLFCQGINTDVGILLYISFSSNQVSVHFESDDRYESDGFALAWKEINPPSISFDCSFDFGLCENWIQDKFDDTDYILKYGATSSPGTGPFGDVGPNGVGGYLYLEASAPTMDGDEAELITPFIFVDPENLHCLNFWYHMHGTSVGVLQVFLTERGYRTKRKLIWSRIGNQSDDWLLAEIPIRVIYPNYIQLIFRAIRGFSWSSDIAIDDVSLYKGNCGSNQLAENFTPWKIYGQSIIESIPMPDADEILIQSITVPTIASVTKLESEKDNENGKFCDEENKIKFDPNTEACCGGQVKVKHPWVK